MWELSDGHKTTCPVDAAALAAISLPLTPLSPPHIPPPAPPVPPRAFAMCSFRDATRRFYLLLVEDLVY